MTRCPRLATIARWVNEQFPGWEAHVERGYCNTDRKIGRLRWPGKGRRGTRLIVRERGQSALSRDGLVLDHNAAETYRHNGEVLDWFLGAGGRLPKGGGR